MNLSGLIHDNRLRERLTLLAARVGWTCWLCDQDAVLFRVLSSVTPAPDLIVTDQPEDLAQLVTLPSVSLTPLVLLHANPAPGEHLPEHSSVDPAQNDDELLLALKTCVNARRFRDRFAQLEGTEPITSLPRHQELFRTLGRRKGAPLGLLVVQIDYAAHLYDGLDPVSKTDLLAALGGHLQAAIPACGLLGFYDAACFVIALPDVNETTLEATGEALVRDVRAPLRYRGGELHVTASVGSAFEAVHTDVERLWTEAWAAMRRGMAEGGNRLAGSPHAMLSRRLPKALEREEFSLVLQPQVNVQSQRLTGAEALLRWQGMEIGELAPNRFIPVAEQRGHMARIGDWVLERGCREASTWFEHLVEPLWLGINVSPQQFYRGAIQEQISRYRTERWFDPSILELELPHDAMLALVDDHRDQLYRLRDWGVRFCLDNLGSSLMDATRLLRCPADTLKIDRSLVARIDTDEQARTLVAQICELGTRFELRVVAVGVERQSQLTTLAQFGCTDIQGFLVSPPVSPRGFRGLLAQAPDLRSPAGGRGR